MANFLEIVFSEKFTVIIIVASDNPLGNTTDLHPATQKTLWYQIYKIISKWSKHIKENLMSFVFLILTPSISVNINSDTNISLVQSTYFYANNLHFSYFLFIMNQCVYYAVLQN